MFFFTVAVELWQVVGDSSGDGFFVAVDVDAGDYATLVSSLLTVLDK